MMVTANDDAKIVGGSAAVRPRSLCRVARKNPVWNTAHHPSSIGGLRDRCRSSECSVTSDFTNVTTAEVARSPVAQAAKPLEFPENRGRIRWLSYPILAFH